MLDIVGAWILASGLLISEREAVELSVTRVPGTTLEENIKHPVARDRLRQARSARVGLRFLVAGFLLQIAGALV